MQNDKKVITSQLLDIDYDIDFNDEKDNSYSEKINISSPNVLHHSSNTTTSNVNYTNLQTNNTSSNQYIPPTGHWKNGIFDCFTNLWPSFACVACGSSLLIMFYSAQISSRIGAMRSSIVLFSYIVFVIIIFFVSAIITTSQTSNIKDSSILNDRKAEVNIEWGVSYYLLPNLFILIFGLWLRCKFIERFRISEKYYCTIFYGICCSSCSICQMGRHIYGYRRLFDGDGRLDGSMDYNSSAFSVEDNKSEQEMMSFIA